MRRGPMVIGLLGLAVIATAALSWEAIGSARSARDTAERVLRDYATFAAAQFAREIESRLEARLAPSLVRARHQIEGHPSRGVPERQPAEDCHCPAPPQAVTTFAVSGTGPVLVEGQPLSDATAGMLIAALPDADGRSRAAIHPIDGGVVAFTSGRYRGETVLLGVVVREAELVDVVSRAVSEATLLPGTLVAPGAAKDLLALRVFDAGGRQWFASTADTSPFAASAALAPRFGGLRVEAAIPAGAASRLVIGGLPAERWPIVVGLLVLSAGLVAAAAVQLRREIRFARQRADFVSGVSHELRTPLAQIRLFGETLLLGRVRSEDEKRRAAEIIVQEARRLGQMVDNVLLFSSADREAAPLDRAAVPLPALVRDVVEAFRPQAASKSASIILTLTGPAVPRLVNANAIRQMLLNLLDNAVKYGPRGQIVRVSLSSAGSRARLVVEDGGPGVALEDRLRIWEPFWRASGSAEGGTGLGLAIVHQLVRRHGGTAIAEAGTPGARFVLDLDAPVAAAGDAPAADAAIQSA